jgi:predicted RNA-binding Zn ribbon-like protein
VHVEGEQLVAVGEAKRKKDAIFNASYDACRLLSRRGMLSSGGRRAKETVAAGWGGPGDEDDDNDDYLDRTGDVERKRARREGTKSAAREIHTKENLLEKIKKLREEQKRLVDKLIALPTVITAEDAEDELEKYMSRIKNSVNANKRKAIQKELEAICLKVAEAESFLQLIRPVKRNYMSVAYQLQNELTPHNNNNNNSSSGNKSNNRNNEIDINSSIDSNESNIMSVIESNTTSNSGSYKANGSEETTKLEATKSGENKKDKKKKTSKRVFVEEQVSTWMPPADQKGDGKTHLNEKYGY